MLAVAVEVAGGEVFDGDAAGIDELARPLARLALRPCGIVDADAALGRVAQVVADADDQLLVGVAVEIGAPDGVAPFQVFVEDVAVPQAVACVAVGRV